MSGIISAEGKEALNARLEDAAFANLDARQSLIADILETYALPGQLEDSIELPELNAALVIAMTEAYEADLDIIANMKGVGLIATCQVRLYTFP